MNFTFKKFTFPLFGTSATLRGKDVELQHRNVLKFYNLIPSCSMECRPTIFFIIEMVVNL